MFNRENLAMTQVSASDFATRLRKEPLLFAQVATANNPQAISQKLVEDGLIDGELKAPELLDAVLEISKELNPAQLRQIFDVPFSFDPENEGSTAGILDSFDQAAEIQQVPEEERTWSTVFPEAAGAVGEAHQDFTHSINPTGLVKSTGHSGCVSCKRKTLRQIRNAIYLGVGVLLLILLIKSFD